MNSQTQENTSKKCFRIEPKKKSNSLRKQQNYCTNIITQFLLKFIHYIAFLSECADSIFEIPDNNKGIGPNQVHFYYHCQYSEYNEL